jgi:hypothetical protein
MEEYKLYDLVHNGYLYVEVQKGMYGLPQAGLLANLLLARCLVKHRHGLPVHKTRPINCSLVVDNF